MRFLFRICWGQPQEATRLLELDASGQDWQDKYEYISSPSQRIPAASKIAQSSTNLSSLVDRAISIMASLMDSVMEKVAGKEWHYEALSLRQVGHMPIF